MDSRWPYRRVFAILRSSSLSLTSAICLCIGLIAFTLIPLCVLIALKAPPFALFALPFSLQLHSDKLAWVHRWLGRLIYICTVAHVATWSVQLARDHRGGTKSGPAWKYMFIYPRFIFAIAVSRHLSFSVPPWTHDRELVCRRLFA